MTDITRILEDVRQGDPVAKSSLLELVYSELRQVARAKMAQERPGQTLQPTALVHEAWLRLGEEWKFENRAHFFSAAAEAMRRILVDATRRKKRIKHGGELEKVDLDGIEIAAPVPNDQLLALDEALDRLIEVNAQAAELVKLCYFVGLSRERAAEELGVSLSTAERLWRFARAWLYQEMNKAGPNGS